MVLGKILILTLLIIFWPKIIRLRSVLDNFLVVKDKVSVIPDGSCLFRALGWWLTGNEDMHLLVRQKLLNFMAISQLSEKYVVVKYNQKVEEYIANKNMAIPTFGVQIYIGLVTNRYTCIKG